MVKGNKKGASLIIFVLMILITITAIVVGYAFLITHEMKGSGVELNEQKALYIAETGIERAMEYLKADTDWSDNNGTSVITENFGAGSYSIDLSSGTRTTIVVESEATVDSGPAQLTRKISQKIRRLPEAFNYAVFSDTTNSLAIRGTLEVNGGDLYARGDITNGPLNVDDGGTVSASRGGLVYSQGSVTASGTYTVGTTPTHTPPMPVLDTTYYNNFMSGFDSDIYIYNTSTDYLGYTGAWEGNPSGVVDIVLSGNRYFSNFVVNGSSSITGTGAIVSDSNLKLQADTTVTPGGGDILFIARDLLKIENRTVIGANTILYAKNTMLRVVNQPSVDNSTLLSGTGIRVLNRAAISGSSLYQSATDNTINADGQNVSLSGCTLLSRGGMRILNADVISDSILYTAATADRIHLDGNKTDVDGSILSNSEFRLINNATVTGIVYTSEAKIKKGTINGSLVADSFVVDKMVAGGEKVTVNYDYSYFPEAPAGLGLDIDGDVNEEGVIVKVPGAWQQL